MGWVPETKRGNGDRSPFAILSDGNGYSAAILAGSWAGAGFTFTSTLPPERVRKETTPSAVANRVWSRPTPTLLPGSILVPRWRTRMLPASTFWPPKRLTPNRWPSESRPLREEPPAFLCAISTLRSLYISGDDLFDLDHRQVLAMAVLAPRILAAPLLEDDQVRPARLLDDRGHHLGAGDRGLADLVADHQHVGELDLRAGLALDPFDLVGLVGGDGVLLSTRAD